MGVLGPVLPDRPEGAAGEGQEAERLRGGPAREQRGGAAAQGGGGLGRRLRLPGTVSCPRVSFFSGSDALPSSRPNLEPGTTSCPSAVVGATMQFGHAQLGGDARVSRIPP